MRSSRTRVATALRAGSVDEHILAYTSGGDEAARSVRHLEGGDEAAKSVRHLERLLRRQVSESARWAWAPEAGLRGVLTQTGVGGSDELRTDQRRMVVRDRCYEEDEEEDDRREDWRWQRSAFRLITC